MQLLQIVILTLIIAFPEDVLSASKRNKRPNDKKPDNGPCGKRFLRQINGKCYYFPSKKLNWYGAQNNCLRKGLNLADLSTEEDFNAVVKFLRTRSNMEDFWFGGNDLQSEGRFTYISSGRPVKYFGKSGFIEPTHRANLDDCLEIRLRNESIMVTDDNCLEEQFFICQTNAVKCAEPSYDSANDQPHSHEHLHHFHHNPSKAEGTGQGSNQESVASDSRPADNSNSTEVGATDTESSKNEDKDEEEGEEGEGGEEGKEEDKPDTNAEGPTGDGLTGPGGNNTQLNEGTANTTAPVGEQIAANGTATQKPAGAEGDTVDNATEKPADGEATTPADGEAATSVAPADAETAAPVNAETAAPAEAETAAPAEGEAASEAPAGRAPKATTTKTEEKSKGAQQVPVEKELKAEPAARTVISGAKPELQEASTKKNPMTVDVGTEQKTGAPIASTTVAGLARPSEGAEEEQAEVTILPYLAPTAGSTPIASPFENDLL